MSVNVFLYLEEELELTIVKTSNLGFPRIGLNREWKKHLSLIGKVKLTVKPS